jgi:hypothetical protein
VIQMEIELDESGYNWHIWCDTCSASEWFGGKWPVEAEDCGSAHVCKEQDD